MTPLLTPLIAGAVGSFFLFILLGIGALAFCAAMDSKLGKEKALFVYTLGLLGLTFFLLRPEPVKTSRVTTKKVRELPTTAGAPVADPFARPAYELDASRNVFQKYSDTRKLPPVTLDLPPDLPLAFPLPPTIPGPAPGNRRSLRGEVPSLQAGDGSAIAEIPDAVFVDYTRVPEDVYDWIVQPGQKAYIYIRALGEAGGKMIREGESGFDRLKWKLARQLEGWREIQVEFAYVGPAKAAAKVLGPDDHLTVRQKNVSTRAAGQDEAQWFVRRTVENLYAEALATHGIGDLSKAGESSLRQAARKMADVGRTGKEGGKGWLKVQQLLEQALVWADENNASSNMKADILLELIEAYRATHNSKAVLRTLAAYARTAPEDQRPWQWLGDAMISIGIPSMGSAYYEVALDRDRSNADSILGAGRAQAMSGDHDEALTTWQKAKSTPKARVRIAEGLLRLGQLEDAKTTIERYLASEPGHPYATLVRGAVYYALGDLETARGVFEAVAAMDTARAERAMACHNLGLTCFRMGQHDAAAGAFLASQKALELGSSTGPFADETVSPSLGEALLAVGVGDLERARSKIESARLEAPGSAYIEFLAGVLAARSENTASAVRGLEASKRLAPEYGELDGWLARTYLRLGEAQLTTEVEGGATTNEYRRAEAFALRAAEREAKADKLAFRMQLRLALTQLRLQDISKKERYERALASAQKVTRESENRDVPAAHAIFGFCHFGLGGQENVKQSIRDFQKVLDDVPDDENHAWKSWRDYAEVQLAAIKHWDGLEEKTVGFDDTNIPKDWKAENPNKVVVKVIDGQLGFSGEASKDGSFRDPIVSVTNGTLFTRDSFQEINFEFRIPAKINGRTANNIVFGVQLFSGRGRGGKLPGIGFFYDRNKMAYRVGGGQNKSFEDGLPKRTGEGVPERAWPSDEWISVRIVRHDYDKGEMAVYVTGADGEETEVFREFVSGFKRSRGKANLWFGGWSNEAERFDVRVRNIRVIRRSK